MNKRGKSWHLIVTALLIVVFSFTALFGVSYTYGDTKNVYIKGAEDIRFGIDIRGGVDVTFMGAGEIDPECNVNATRLGPRPTGAGYFSEKESGTIGRAASHGAHQQTVRQLLRQSGHQFLGRKR